MCERGIPCSECPDIVACDDPDAPGIQYRAQQIPFGSESIPHRMILQALQPRSSKFQICWHALPEASQRAAARLVFDGGNPNDILDVLAGAFFCRASEEALPELPSRTLSDPDAYLG
jgi:hypothetical protein